MQNLITKLEQDYQTAISVYKLTLHNLARGSVICKYNQDLIDQDFERCLELEIAIKVLKEHK